MHKASFCRVVTTASIFVGWPSAELRAAEVGTNPEPTPILGGDVVEPCGFPTAVSMGGSCTGTLVHPQVVVYAAHCGDGVPWIRFGDLIDEPGLQVVPQMCQTHPIGEYGFGSDAAFCVLAEPVEGIPVAPPLMGCEAEAALQVGRPVTVAGYGTSDDEQEPYGIKRYLDTQITALSWDEVFIGGVDEGVCYGDSGGPTFAQVADGSWRAFGITSWGQPGCGFGGYLSTITHNIEWIETASGIDITPCHDGLGRWDPSPECIGFDLELHASGGTWDAGCDFGDVGGWVQTCGAAFNPELLDDVPPQLRILSPPTQSRFDLPEGDDVAFLEVSIEALDPGGWGVGAVELVIELDGVEQARLPDPAGPFGFDNLAFPEGAWTLRVEGSDRAGNPAVSEPVVFGVNVDPPPAPEPEAEDSTGGDDMPEPAATTGDDEDTEGEGEPAAGDSGCGCRSGSGGGGGGLGWMALGLLALARRRAALWVGLGAAAGCGGDDVPMSADDEGATLASTSAMTPASATTGDTEPDPSADTTTTEAPAPACGNGIVEDGELCDDGNEADGDGCSAACEPSGVLLGELRWPDGDLDSNGDDIALAGDGSFVVAGRRAIADGGTAAVLLGLDADLGLVWSTEVEGMSPADLTRASALSVADDGTIWAVGRNQRELMDDDIIEPWIARFDPDGSLQWSEIVTGAEARYLGVAALPGGDAIAGGWQVGIDGTARQLIRRHDSSDGATVWEIVESVVHPESVALSVVRQPSGEIVVAGWIAGFNGFRDMRLRRLDEDGATVDTTRFAEPLTSYYPRAMAVDASGDVVVCGSVVRASAENAMLGRFELGSASPAVWLQRIDSVGPGSTGCGGLAIDDEGRVVYAGYAFHQDTGLDPAMGRLAADGEILWSSRVPPTEGFMEDLAEGVVLDEAGDLVVVGTVESGFNDPRLWVGRVRG